MIKFNSQPVTPREDLLIRYILETINKTIVPSINVKPGDQYTLCLFENTIHITVPCHSQKEVARISDVLNLYLEDKDHI